MKVNVTKKPETSQVELKISVPANEFKPFIEKAARKLSSDQPIKGFRPGKASVAVVIQHFGQDRLLKEAMDSALPVFFVQAIMDDNIEAITRPSITIEKLGLEEPLEFTAIVDVLPEVTLGDPSKIKAEKRDVKVDEKQVEKELNYIAKMRSSYLDVARPAEEGDMVSVDFDISINGTPIEGGQSKNHPIVLGEGRFIPEFEGKIKGMSAEEDRQFEMTFPAEYHKSDLAGKKANVVVKAHRVQKRVIPELNDDFAKQLGNFTDLEQLKKELRNNMGKELEQKEQERYSGELAEQLSDITTFGHIPEALIEKEIDNRVTEFAQMLSLQQKTIDDYLARQKKTLDQMRVDMRPAAEKNVKVGLTLRTFAKQNDIEVTPEEIQAEANEFLRQYDDPEKAAEEIDAEHLREHIETILKNKKTLAKLAEMTQSKK